LYHFINIFKITDPKFEGKIRKTEGVCSVIQMLRARIHPFASALFENLALSVRMQNFAQQLTATLEVELFQVGCR